MTVRMWAHIKLSTFYYKKRLNKLRFTPLATTVYLSHTPSATPSRNLSSNRFPKCIRNKGCFISLQENEIGKDILIYIRVNWVFQIDMDYTRCWWNPKMLEYNWTWLLYKCMYAATRCFFFTFPTSKELYIFIKKDHCFLSYTKHYLSAKN